MILRSDGSPFSVRIDGAEPESCRRSFRVTGPAPQSESALTRAYDLTGPSQTAYLDLFERLASDFGTRPPSNPRRFVHATTAPLRALLTENLSADILYGYGDPGALRVLDESGTGQSYYVVVTSNDAPQAFPIVHSRDLRAWEFAGCVFPAGSKPAWAAAPGPHGEYWAPEMHAIGDRFVVCFAAREADGSFAIGLAHAASPSGPFVAGEQPLVRGGAIDPNLFVDDDGSVMLSWKQDDNDVWPGLVCTLLRERPDLVAALFEDRRDATTARFNAALWPWTSTLRPMERFFVQQLLIGAVVSQYGQFEATLQRLLQAATDIALRDQLSAILMAMHTNVYAQQLDPKSWSLHGEATIILQNDQTWEGHLVEGPWVTKRHGKYYVFYSGNDFSTAEYGIGVGVADSPLGPYKKTDRPFLQSTPDWWGPGHPSVADGPDGRPWLFLHAYRPGHAGYKEFRALLAVPLRFANGNVEPA